MSPSHIYFKMAGSYPSSPSTASRTSSSTLSSTASRPSTCSPADDTPTTPSIQPTNAALRILTTHPSPLPRSTQRPPTPYPPDLSSPPSSPTAPTPPSIPLPPSPIYQETTPPSPSPPPERYSNFASFSDAEISYLYLRIKHLLLPPSTLRNSETRSWMGERRWSFSGEPSFSARQRRVMEREEGRKAIYQGANGISKVGNGLRGMRAVEAQGNGEWKVLPKARSIEVLGRGNWSADRATVRGELLEGFELNRTRGLKAARREREAQREKEARTARSKECTPPPPLPPRWFMRRPEVIPPYQPEDSAGINSPSRQPTPIPPPKSPPREPHPPREPSRRPPPIPQLQPQSLYLSHSHPSSSSPGHASNNLTLSYTPAGSPVLLEYRPDSQHWVPTSAVVQVSFRDGGVASVGWRRDGETEFEGSMPVSPVLLSIPPVAEAGPSRRAEVQCGGSPVARAEIRQHVSMNEVVSPAGSEQPRVYRTAVPDVRAFRFKDGSVGFYRLEGEESPLSLSSLSQDDAPREPPRAPPPVSASGGSVEGQGNAAQRLESASATLQAEVIVRDYAYNPPAAPIEKPLPPVPIAASTKRQLFIMRKNGSSWPIDIARPKTKKKSMRRAPGPFCFSQVSPEPSPEGYAPYPNNARQSMAQEAPDAQKASKKAPRPDSWRTAGTVVHFSGSFGPFEEAESTKRGGETYKTKGRENQRWSSALEASLTTDDGGSSKRKRGGNQRRPSALEQWRRTHESPKRTSSFWSLAAKLKLTTLPEHPPRL